MTPFVFLSSALILGLVSSLHCLGMCGPLVIGILSPESGKWRKVQVLLLYHSGRLLIYGLLGIISGLLINRLIFANIQQSISIVLGSLVLLWVIADRMNWLRNPGISFPGKIVHRLMAKFLTVNGRIKYLLLGGVNGLLPCGMVYIAVAGAMAAPGAGESFAFMVLFGLGTLPLLTLVSGLGAWIKSGIRRYNRLIQPAFLLVFSVLLIVRGLNLGVPYLSPAAEKHHQTVQMDCCKGNHSTACNHNK